MEVYSKHQMIRWQHRDNAAIQYQKRLCRLIGPTTRVLAWGA